MADKEIFIRREYSDTLDRNTHSFKHGSAKNIALLGERKCGKTLLLKDHLKHAKDVVAVYVDLNKISLNPENFAVEFIGNIIFNFLKKAPHEYKNFQTLENILNSKNHIGKNAFSLIKTIENELLKIKPDQKLIVQNAFEFAKKLAGDTNKKFLIAIDNFENILDLNNFSSVGNVLDLIDFKSKEVCYIVASSAVRQCIDLLKSFECYEIKNFDKNENAQLVSSIIGSHKDADEIFNFSKGHPFVTSIIAHRYNKTKDVRKAFAVELLQKNEQLYNFCSDSYNFYYNRARGQTLLKSILKIIANEELRLSEIARKVYRSAPVTKSVIERLMDVDVIYKKDNKFYFSNETLRLWLKLTSSGYEIDDADEKMLDEAMKEL